MKKHSNDNKKEVNITTFLQSEIDPAYARRAKILLRELEIEGREEILDIGCGRGFYEKAVITLFPKVHLTAIDTNNSYLQQAKANVVSDQVRFLQVNGKKLPFANDSFDRIICSEVLEHIDDDSAVVTEMMRVLKPAGKVVITVPNAKYPFFWDPLNFILEHLFGKHMPSHIWWLAGIWADHMRLYTDKQLQRKFQTAGFVNIKLWHSTFYCFPFSHFLLYGIGKNLVELGIAKGKANRFNFTSKPSLAVKLFQAPFQLIDRFNSDDSGRASSMNLVLTAGKSIKKK